MVCCRLELVGFRWEEVELLRGLQETKVQGKERDKGEYDCMTKDS